MQTAKNLFLSHERTLSRKFQELLIARMLEQSLSKERILELYLNIAELGPGIYGVKQASETYFSKHPFDLTLKEAAFLSTLLPSPVKRFQAYCQKTVSKQLQTNIERKIERMLEYNRITIEEYHHSLASNLDFVRSEATHPECQKSYARSQKVSNSIR